MRLIDEDELSKRLIDSIEYLKNQHYETYASVGDSIKFVIDNQPTAYDPDKVVSELKTDSSVKLYGSQNSDNYMIPVNKAIEIVKQGGVADDVCECRLIKGYKFLHETSCGAVFDMQNGFKYCPYCGKKIKVVE